jgi:hypothetical protein
MCATDLDLKLEITEDEQAPGPQPARGRYAGVAWGLVERAGAPAARAYAAGDHAEAAPSR